MNYQIMKCAHTCSAMHTLLTRQEKFRVGILYKKKKTTERKNRPESEDGSGTEVLEMLFPDRWLIGRCILATVTARK